MRRCGRATPSLALAAFLFAACSAPKPTTTEIRVASEAPSPLLVMLSSVSGDYESWFIVPPDRVVVVADYPNKSGDPLLTVVHDPECVALSQENQIPVGGGVLTSGVVIAEDNHTALTTTDELPSRPLLAASQVGSPCPRSDVVWSRRPVASD